MRSGILSIGVSLLVLGLAPAYAGESARFGGIGAGISHAPGETTSHFLRAPDDGGSDRPTRTAVLADNPPATGATPRWRGMVGFDRLGLRSSQVRLDPAVRDDLRRSAALPPDLSALPQPAGEPNSDRPTPMIGARDIGGVVGLSYKIKP